MARPYSPPHRSAEDTRRKAHGACGEVGQRNIPTRRKAHGACDARSNNNCAKRARLGEWLTGSRHEDSIHGEEKNTYTRSRTCESLDKAWAKGSQAQTSATLQSARRFGVCVFKNGIAPGERLAGQERRPKTTDTTSPQEDDESSSAFFANQANLTRAHNDSVSGTRRGSALSSTPPAGKPQRDLCNEYLKAKIPRGSCFGLRYITIGPFPSSFPARGAPCVLSKMSCHTQKEVATPRTNGIPVQVNTRYTQK